MIPSCQQLKTVQFTSTKIDEGLKVRKELAIINGSAYIEIVN